MEPEHVRTSSPPPAFILARVLSLAGRVFSLAVF